MRDFLSEAEAAFRNGTTADFLHAQQDGVWGQLWTIPPCSPAAMEKAGKQFTRSRSSQVRHYRRAMLNMRMLIEPLLVMVETELPGRRQRVFDIQTGIEVKVPTYLEDAALAALEIAFIAFAVSSEAIVTDEQTLHQNAAIRRGEARTLRV
jgi:hypothetical protein